MIKKLYLVILSSLLFNCSNSKISNEKTIEAEFTVKKELLGPKEIVHQSGFSFYPPAGWESSEELQFLDFQMSEDYQVFVDPLDSSVLIVSNQAVSLPEFENKQVSNFLYNKIPIEQTVLQNSNSVLFNLKIGDSREMYIIFAIPRQHIQNKAKFVESSIGSIKHF